MCGFSWEHGFGVDRASLVTSRSRADQFAVGHEEDQEISIFDEAIAIQVRKAARRHRGIGAIKRVVLLEEQRKIRVVYEAVVVQV